MFVLALTMLSVCRRKPTSALYSYIVPLLTTVSGVPLGYVPLVLFGLGFCGVFGNLIGGWLADRNPVATMIASLATIIAFMLILAALSHSA